MIKTQGNKYVVLDSTGSKVLGRYNSQVEAIKAERKFKVGNVLKDSTDRQQGRG